MRKIVLYIAMSLDGYIADANGGVSWLRGQDPDSESEGSYPEFVRDIDTVVMGWETYHQVITELSPVLAALWSSGRLERDGIAVEAYFHT